MCVFLQLSECIIIEPLPTTVNGSLGSFLIALRNYWFFDEAVLFFFITGEFLRFLILDFRVPYVHSVQKSSLSIMLCALSSIISLPPYRFLRLVSCVEIMGDL